MRLTPARSATTRPTVSVVIPCYNYGRYLPECVASVTAQPGVELEIIVVDDASTDGSQDIARALAAADPRIRLLLHAENARHIATYNDGLALATGDYVVLLSADDLLAPGSLARATSLMERHPEVGLVYGYAPEFTGAPPASRAAPVSWTLWSGREWLGWFSRRGTNIVMNPEAVLRGSLMRELIGYRADMPQSADMELWMRAAIRADVGRVNGPDQAYYRVHEANMHLTDFAGLMTDFRARLDTFDRFFAENADRVPGAGALLARAHRAMAREAVRYARAAQRGGEVGGAAAEELTAFARQMWAGVIRTPVWRGYRRRPARGLRLRVEARAAQLRSGLLWRRWRRFGV